MHSAKARLSSFLFFFLLLLLGLDSYGLTVAASTGAAAAAARSHGYTAPGTQHGTRGEAETW